MRLQSVRGTTAPASRKIDPVGVVVTAEIELIGLRATEVWLRSHYVESRLSVGAATLAMSRNGPYR